MILIGTFSVSQPEMVLPRDMKCKPFEPLQTPNDNKPWNICDQHMLLLCFSARQWYLDQLFFLFQNRNYKLHIESEYIV